MIRHFPIQSTAVTIVTHCITKSRQNYYIYNIILYLRINQWKNLKRNVLKKNNLRIVSYNCVVDILSGMLIVNDTGK